MTNTEVNKTQIESVRIPKGFYDDHCERELPAPKVLGETQQHYWIHPDPGDPDYVELVSDARYYASPDMEGAWDNPKWPRMAKALLKALKEALA